MLKRLFSIITISLIITGSFFNAYSNVNHVYADDNTDAWTQVTTNQQLVEAFKAYCKSRDVTIEGSVADAVTSFTTKTFNGLVNTLGIDVNTLQANLKYQTDGNLGYRFLFNTFSIDAYNRIFAQFLQDNELSVGDSANEQDNILYSGTYITDSQGNGALAFICSGTDTQKVVSNSRFLYFGTPYMYSHETLASSSQTYFYFPAYGSSGATLNFNRYDSGGDWTTNWGQFIGVSVPANVYANIMYGTNRWGTVFNGYASFVIFPEASANKVYFCLYSHLGGSENNHRLLAYECNLSSKQNTNVYITTNNTVINNNNYEGDTIINNNGDTNYYPDEPDIPDPNPGPTPDPPTIPDSGGWQDFSLPEMPNDWLIYGMEKKFPFDIPFNILFALSLLNHEPEIPKFEGDIDLKVCTWHYDIDLTPFDDIATILRKFEVLGFIIGLAILTKNLINWG